MSTARSPFAAARQLVVVLHPGIKVGAVMDVDVDATVQQLEIVAHHAILIHGLPLPFARRGWMQPKRQAAFRSGTIRSEKPTGGKACRPH